MEPWDVVPAPCSSRIRQPPLTRPVGGTLLIWLLVGATLLGLVYLEEYGRGRLAWERCRRQLQARGATLDWSALNPAPVPADLNFFKAPSMSDWFGSGPSNELTSKLSFRDQPANGDQPRGKPLAELTLVTPQAQVTAAEADLVLSYRDSTLSLSGFGGTPPERLDAADAIIPLIIMDEVPLTNAILYLARQAGLAFAIDPSAGLDAGNGPLIVSCRWENLTARQALTAMLNHYDLRLVGGTHREVAVVKPKQWPDPTLEIEPPARASMDRLCRSVLEQAGQPVPLPGLVGSQGLALLAQPLPPVKPLRVVIRTDELLTGKELARFFPTNLLTAWPRGADGFQLECLSNHTFQAFLCPSFGCSAAEYLEQTDRCLPEFDLIRAALKRPYIQLASECAEPESFYGQNFVATRILVQTLAQRAQCHLLLHQPEAALRELTLIHDFCRVLTRRPVTFVASMINVAVRSLYADVVADGLRLRVWQEPQLAVLQRQLQEVKLLPPMVDGFQWERANLLRILQRGQGVALIRTNHAVLPGPVESDLIKTLKNARLTLYGLAPRGWVYQNMVTVAGLSQGYLDAVDLSREMVLARQIDAATDHVQQTLDRTSPETFIAAAVFPMFSHAWQIAARNQTRVNQAMLACALERHRLAQGCYPGSLSGLIPRYVTELPPDVIDGRPMHYRLEADGRFTLYSVGWNGLDDAGLVAAGSADGAQGDWVWDANPGS